MTCGRLRRIEGEIIKSTCFPRIEDFRLLKRTIFPLTPQEFFTDRGQTAAVRGTVRSVALADTCGARSVHRPAINQGVIGILAQWNLA